MDLCCIAQMRSCGDMEICACCPHCGPRNVTAARFLRPRFISMAAWTRISHNIPAHAYEAFRSSS